MNTCKTAPNHQGSPWPELSKERPTYISPCQDERDNRTHPGVRNSEVMKYQYENILGQYRIIRQEHSAGDFAVEKGSFSQEYFVYFKKK